MLRLRIALATEDILSEEIGCRLINELGPSVEVGQKLRRDGNGYLKSKINNFCEMACRVGPVLLLTDLDNKKCPVDLIQDWMGTRPCPDKLLFRVVVREIESWLLADHDAMKNFLKAGANKLPDNPDYISDPKRMLLTMARGAPRDVRADLLPASGALAARGLGYNNRLVELIRNDWDPERAAMRSDSLSRVRDRLRSMVLTLTSQA